MIPSIQILNPSENKAVMSLSLKSLPRKLTMALGEEE